MAGLDRTAALICRECSLATGGCCACPDQSEPGFPISPAEVERMAAYADLAAPAGGGADPRERVVMSAPNNPEFLSALEALLPRHKKAIAALFPAGGAYARPRLTAAGDCVFRGEAGCRLPREARPWYCRIFPLWMRGEAVTLLDFGDCRLCLETRSPVEAMRLLGMTALDVRTLFAAMLRDWNINP